jgi:hypothetical protein
VPVHAPPLVPSHSSPLQQGIVALQGWPGPGQLELVWQVPLVMPGGKSQERPEQQSAFAVQIPFRGWQFCGVWQVPPLQMPEQQELPVEHVEPLA